MAVIITLEDDLQTVRHVKFRGNASNGKNQANEPAGTTKKFGIVPNPGKKKNPKGKGGGIGEGDCIYDYTTGILYCP